jgi:hypothetical protein
MYYLFRLTFWPDKRYPTPRRFNTQHSTYGSIPYTRYPECRVSFNIRAASYGQHHYDSTTVDTSSIFTASSWTTRRWRERQRAVMWRRELRLDEQTERWVFFGLPHEMG